MITVVVCSLDPSKDAHSVPAFLKKVGYDVIPVNQKADQILEHRSFDNLLQAGGEAELPIDLVAVFRPADEVPEVLDETIEIGANVLWLQLGIRDNRSARRGEKEGLTVFQDRCIRAETLQFPRHF